jgi:hypothetical protein
MYKHSLNGKTFYLHERHRISSLKKVSSYYYFMTDHDHLHAIDDLPDGYDIFEAGDRFAPRLRKRDVTGKK